MKTFYTHPDHEENPINAEEKEWRDCVVQDFKMLNNKINSFSFIALVVLFILMIDLIFHVLSMF